MKEKRSWKNGRLEIGKKKNKKIKKKVRCSTTTSKHLRYAYVAVSNCVTHTAHTYYIIK